MSSFAWLDRSEHERRKALDLIRLLGQRETRDELGIGTVRDAFSDTFFPGTSTIQTRARYFLFVPWMYVDLEKVAIRSPGQDFAQIARRRELDLIEVLGDSTDADGTIGILARRSLQRLPSNIYWQGLGVWGIRLFKRTQPQYHRLLSRSRTGVLNRDDDGEPIYRSAPTNWHSSIPDPPRNWAADASFSLLNREAVFLRERLLVTNPKALLTYLIDNDIESGDERFCWEHQHYARFPAHIKEQLEHARNFSEAMHGAQLLYNLMLAEAKPNRDWVRNYRTRLDNWTSLVTGRRTLLRKWDRRLFWDIVTSAALIPPLTQAFVNRWLTLVIDQIAPSGVRESEDARRLIRERERALKGENGARLFSPRALEIWDGRSGTEQLDFRWPQARRIAGDILAGLHRSP